MTEQELFDTVALHLITQGKRATNQQGVPVYRASDGSKCAIGIIIPDRLYVPEIEYMDIRMILLGYHNHNIYMLEN